MTWRPKRIAIRKAAFEEVVKEKTLATFAPYAFAILRIIAGLLLVGHGGQKTFGWFGGQPVPARVSVWFGGNH